MNIKPQITPLFLQLQLILVIYFLWTPKFVAQNSPTQADSLGFWRLSPIETLYEEERYAEAIVSLNMLFPIYAEEKKWNAWTEAYDWLYKNTREIDDKKTWEQTKQTFIKGIQRLEYQLDTLPNVASILYGRTGQIHHDIGDYETSAHFYEKALKPTELIEDDAFLLRLYANLGTVKWFLGDDYQALNYQEKALSLAEAAQEDYLVAAIIGRIGDVWRTLEPVKSIPYYEQVQAIYPNDSENLMLLSKAYRSGADDTQKALKVAQKALKYAEGNYATADALHELGNVFFAKEAYNKAIQYYQQAENFAEKSYGKQSPEYAKIFFFEGNAWAAKKDYQRALDAYNKTLQCLLPLFQPETNAQNPSLDDFTTNSLWILEALKEKSKVFEAKYAGSKKIIDKQKALETAELALTYFQKITARYSDNRSRYALNDTYFSINNHAMDMAFDLAEISNNDSYFQRAFALSQQTKAAVLTETLFRKELKQIAGLPDSVLAIEKEKHATIAHWEKELMSATNEKTLAVIRDSLFYAKRALDELEKTFQEDYPVYAESKYRPLELLDIATIQASLPDSTLLVEYFLGDSAIYTFAVSKTAFKAVKTAKDTIFDKALEEFVHTISDWEYVQNFSGEASAVFLKNGHLLYDILLPETIKPEEYTRLIIVPDGELGRLPFELLLNTSYEGNWTDLAVPFLLKEVAISYRFSSKLLSEKGNEQLGEWGGYGLEYDNLSQFQVTAEEEKSLAIRYEGRLPYADDEVLTIASFFNGKTWLNEEATRTNFFNNAGQYGILHLATHGIVDEKNPLRSRLLFARSIVDEDPAVYASEIYGMQLNAGLAVLSACNTGTGTWRKGEGTMSLARAFAFAGCPSLLMSLWSVSDQSTSELMTSFYQNLKAGQPKDIALQNAKLLYLNNASTEYTMPIYWASFVAIGDMETLPLDNGNSWSFYNWSGGVALLFLLLIGFGFFIRRR